MTAPLAAWSSHPRLRFGLVWRVARANPKRKRGCPASAKPQAVSLYKDVTCHDPSFSSAANGAILPWRNSPKRPANGAIRVSICAVCRPTSNRARHDEADYCQKTLDLLGRYDLQLGVLSNHRVGQAVCDRIEARHKKILPDSVWGDGDPQGVQQRAAAEMIASIRARRSWA